MTPTAAPGPRTGAERKADTLAQLRTPAVDAWVATASATTGAHLVPLSLAWIDDRIVLATELTARTARNIVEQGAARVGLGGTRDVIMIDTVLESSVPLAEAGSLAARYADQADWDPRESPGAYVYLVMRPVRIQAWREVDELAGRTLMKNGIWVV